MAETSRMMQWMKKALALDFTKVTGDTVTVNEIERWENSRKPFYEKQGKDWLQYCENLRDEIYEIKQYGESKNGFDKEWAKKWVQHNFRARRAYVDRRLACLQR